jgi:hypothetical protein
MASRKIKVSLDIGWIFDVGATSNILSMSDSAADN